MVTDYSTTIPSLASKTSAISTNDLAILKKTAPNITDPQWNDINLALSNGVLSPSGRDAALKAIVARGGMNVDNKTITGSAKYGIDQNIDSANKNASNTMNPAGSTTQTQANPPITDGTQKPPVVPPVAVTSDPIISNINSQFNTLTNQYNTGVQTENSNYQQNVNDANATFLPVYNQTTKDQASAVAQAGAAYDAQNPHASAEERANYLAIVSSSFDNNLAEMAATHTANLNSINQAHQANVQNMQSQYTSAQASLNSSLASQYQQNFINLNTELNTNPPDTSAIGSEITQAMSKGMSLEDAINSSPTLQPFLQLAMTSGQFPTEQAALQYVLNPTLGEKKLDISQKTADAAIDRVGIEAGQLDLNRQIAGGSTDVSKPSLLDSIKNDFTGIPNVQTTQKKLGSGTITADDPLGLGI